MPNNDMTASQRKTWARLKDLQCDIEDAVKAFRDGEIEDLLDLMDDIECDATRVACEAEAWHAEGRS